MGGCSSKPQTSERACRTPSNQDVNLILDGLKAIDPSNRSPYKGSQHTLQSLFIQHHRDGEDGLENAQTLQELLQDTKAPPIYENESGGNAETQLASKDLPQLCKPSSPISVLPDLAQQDAEKYTQTEGLLLPQDAAHEGTPALSVLAEQHADHGASMEAPDCKIGDVTVEPKSDLPPSHETNLLESISADPVLHEIRASKATEMAPSEVQALDAEAVEAGINRHGQEAEGGKHSGELAAECKVSEGPKEEHGMEAIVETRMQAELELEEAEKAIEGEKAGLQAESITVGEKIEVQDREHIESEELGVQKMEKATESEKDGRRRKEGEVEDKSDMCVSVPQEGERKELQDEDMACVQDVVTSVLIEHAGVPDGGDTEETASAKKVGTGRRDKEDEELQGGLQSNQETEMQASHDDQSLAFTQTKAKTSVDDACMQPDSIAAACELASMENLDEAFNEELNSDQEKFTSKENSVKEAALEPTERLDFAGEKLRSESIEHIQNNEVHEQSIETNAQSTGQAKLDDVPDDMVSTEREKIFHHEQPIPNSLVETELNKKVHDQALELSSGDNKKADDTLLEESDTTDNIESSKIDPSVELEHDKSNIVDCKEKKEASIEVTHNGLSDADQSSRNVESTYSGQITKPNDELDLNVHRDTGAGGFCASPGYRGHNPVNITGQTDAKDGLPN